MAHDVVESILRDRQGFLWVATHTGLKRYDGYTFKTYKHDAEKSPQFERQ